MKFSDLFYLGKNLSPVEDQNLRGEIFELKFQEISQNRMQLWSKNQENYLTENTLLLGVCPSWNFYDLYLLDCINDALGEIKNAEVFKVLDIDSLTGLDDIQRIFGNIEPKQLPILRIWEKDVLLKSIWGWEAKNFLIDKYKFIWLPPERDYLK